MTRTIEKDIARAIRKYWPAKRKNALVCLTEREFEARIDRIMDYLAISTSHQTIDGEKDRLDYSLAGPEIRQYIETRLSSQWVRLIDEPDGAKSERVRHYPATAKPIARPMARHKPEIARSAFKDMPVKRDGYEFMRFKAGEARMRWRGQRTDENDGQ